MLWLLSLLQLAQAIEITPWLLPNEEERKTLTQQYLEAHYTGTLSGKLEKDVLMEPKMVVVHWTGVSSAKSTWYTFASATLSGRTSLQGAGALNVSSHFLVDRDGTIYQLLDEKRIARHCIGLNHVAIGIENVGGGKQYPLTKEQLKANTELIEYLSGNHNITEVIGHFEVSEMEEHPYFSEKNPKYRSIKLDPGAVFMFDLRTGLQEKGLSFRSYSSVPSESER